MHLSCDGWKGREKFNFSFLISLIFNFEKKKKDLGCSKLHIFKEDENLWKVASDRNHWNIYIKLGNFVQWFSFIS